MSEGLSDFLEKLARQRGVRYLSERYDQFGGLWQNRRKLIREYAGHLNASGHDVTFVAIREMLRSVDRGYSLKPDQISSALAVLYKSGEVRRQPKGRPVKIAGTKYPSARRAAEEFGVSPQTVLNRIKSDRETWKDWRHAD